MIWSDFYQVSTRVSFWKWSWPLLVSWRISPIDGGYNLLTKYQGHPSIEVHLRLCLGLKLNVSHLADLYVLKATYEWNLVPGCHASRSHPACHWFQKNGGCVKSSLKRAQRIFSPEKNDQLDDWKMIFSFWEGCFSRANFVVFRNLSLPSINFQGLYIIYVMLVLGTPQRRERRNVDDKKPLIQLIP